MLINKILYVSLKLYKCVPSSNENKPILILFVLICCCLYDTTIQLTSYEE